MPSHSDLSRRFSDAALNLALLIRVHPHLYFRRQMVRIDISGDRASYKITQELSLPNEVALDEPLLIPMASGRKGLLLDDSKVTTSSGFIRRLTSAEEMALAALIISSAYRRALDDGRVEERYPAEYHRHLANLTSIPTSPPSAAIVAIRQCLEWIDGLRFVPDPSRLESLVHQALFFGEGFVKAVEVRNSAARELVLARENDELPVPLQPTSINSLAKRMLGRRTSKFAIELSDVTDAASFHVLVSSPPGHHIHEQSVEVRRDGPLGGNIAGPLPRQLYRASRVGADQAHIYFHPQTEADLSLLRSVGLRLNISLAEDFPGSLLPALLSGLPLLAVSLLITLFARHALPVDNSHPSGLAAAFPAFLLTVPGIASLAFRPQDDSAVINAPLVSALLPIVYSVCAFVLGGAYFAAVLNPRHNHRVFYSVAWPTVAILALAVIYLLLRCARKLRAELPMCQTDGG